jgi:hypothetical protein
VIGLDHVVLNVSANAVLRAEKRRQLKIITRFENVGSVPQVRHHGRLIADKPYTLAGDQVRSIA